MPAMSKSDSVDRDEIRVRDGVRVRRGAARGTVVRGDGEEISSKEALYEGTVRVVTEADIAADPRLVSASVVAGQLYDFSNLPHIPDGAAEADVEHRNKVKGDQDEARVRREDRIADRTAFTSEDDRVRMGIASDEELAARAKADEEARKRVEEDRNRGIV